MTATHSNSCLRFALIATLVIGSAGCLVSPAPHSSYRPIHALVLNGDVAGVQADLRATPSDANLAEDGGLRPLHLAALHCQGPIIKILLAAGADVNAVADGGATPLHFAAQEGCTVGITALLAGGARLNAQDDQGHTPRDRALLWHHPEVAALLGGPAP